MNTLKISGRTSLLREIVTAILVVAGMSLVGMSVADGPYSGTAVKCYVASRVGDGPNEIPVGKGKVVITDIISVWRIDSDADPMNGWEYTYDNLYTNKQFKGTGLIKGSLEMFPDVAHQEEPPFYDGKLYEEGYSFKTNKTPSGVYLGEGSLDGVTVTYQTTYAGTTDGCPASDIPHQCDEVVLSCTPISDVPNVTYDVFIMDGQIEGYTTP